MYRVLLTKSGFEQVRYSLIDGHVLEYRSLQPDDFEDWGRMTVQTAPDFTFEDFFRSLLSLPVGEVYAIGEDAGADVFAFADECLDEQDRAVAPSQRYSTRTAKILVRRLASLTHSGGIKRLERDAYASLVVNGVPEDMGKVRASDVVTLRIETEPTYDLEYIDWDSIQPATNRILLFQGIQNDVTVREFYVAVLRELAALASNPVARDRAMDQTQATGT